MTKTEDTSMRVIQTATTKSISGRSSLTYQLGCTPEDKVHIRITKNSGNGFVNTSWYSIDDIHKVLANGSKSGPLTSYLLEPLIKGSSNTPAFVMAALMNERLLRVLKGKKRGHELLDPEGFTARMDKLVSAKGTTEGKAVRSTTRKAPTKKAAIKKKAISGRKTATST